MTDLVERVVDPDSSNVEPNTADVDNLLAQLEILNQEDYHLICFHKKVFQTLVEYFESNPRELPHNITEFTAFQDSRQLNCYRVWFHANWGANKDKIPELKNQLGFLSTEINNGARTDLSRWQD